MEEDRTLLGWTPELTVVALVGGLLLCGGGLLAAYGPRAESCWLSSGPEAMALYERHQKTVQYDTSVSSWPAGRTCTYSAGGETLTIGPGWLPTISQLVGGALSVASCVALSRRMP